LIVPNPGPGRLPARRPTGTATAATGKTKVQRHIQPADNRIANFNRFDVAFADQTNPPIESAM
jgi:hypothetical protein